MYYPEAFRGLSAPLWTTRIARLRLREQCVSEFWPRRSPPEMPVIRSVTSAICHRKNHPGADRPGELDRLLDLLVSRS